MKNDDIIIRFLSFDVSRFPYWADVDGWSLNVGSGKTTGAMSVDWCSLPDILLEQRARKFVGLSFSIVAGYDKDVQAFVKTVGDEKCRYVSVDEPHRDSRYQGFGKMNRLELYWEEPSEAVICEAASLDNGTWIFLSTNVDKAHVLAPFGYWLTMVGETKEDHQLR